MKDLIEKNSIKANYKQKAFAGLSIDRKVWRKSASGGAFIEICKSWGDEKTIVCGATWNGFSVKHMCLEGVSSAQIFSKSKYIASTLGECFKQIKEYQKDGYRIVFSGTPCQVAGLRMYLNNKLDNILLIDLICHGVGSNKVFNTCINTMEKQLQMKIESYSFRSKRKWYERSIQYIDNTKQKIYIQDDPYVQLYLSQNCLRPSCGNNCVFRTSNRQGDITIADFKSLIKVFPYLAGEKYNYSTIVINSLKGESILKILEKNMKLIECDVTDMEKYNPLFYRKTKASKDRDNFFYDYLYNPQECIRKWTKPVKVVSPSLKSTVYELLPIKIRKIIIKHLLRSNINRNFESRYSNCSLSEIIVDNKDNKYAK